MLSTGFGVPGSKTSKYADGHPVTGTHETLTAHQLEQNTKTRIVFPPIHTAIQGAYP